MSTHIQPYLASVNSSLIHSSGEFSLSLSLSHTHTHSLTHLLTHTHTIYIYIYIYCQRAPSERLVKRLDEHYTRMLRAVLNKSWKQHPTKQQLYVHLLPIPQTIQVGRVVHAVQCLKSKTELVSVFLLWVPPHRFTSAGRPAKTYIHQLCTDTGYCLKDSLRAMINRYESRECSGNPCCRNAYLPFPFILGISIIIINKSLYIYDYLINLFESVVERNHLRG